MPTFERGAFFFLLICGLSVQIKNITSNEAESKNITLLPLPLCSQQASGFQAVSQEVKATLHSLRQYKQVSKTKLSLRCCKFQSEGMSGISARQMGRAGGSCPPQHRLGGEGWLCPRCLQLSQQPPCCNHPLAPKAGRLWRGRHAL